MIIFITGASHTGKTALSQRLLEKLSFSYLSIDHLKMGLIRSGNTKLTPLSSDDELTEYLWPIVCEIAKTAIENGQNLIIEGCYIPHDWRTYFSDEYLSNIRLICLAMSEGYIKARFEDIKAYANVIEKRLDDDFSLNEALKDNADYAKRFADDDLILIDGQYDLEKLLKSLY